VGLNNVLPMHYRLIFLFFLPLKNVSLATIKGEIEKTFPSLGAQSVGAFQIFSKKPSHLSPIFRPIFLIDNVNINTNLTAE
jgi:hypothetical protein